MIDRQRIGKISIPFPYEVWADGLYLMDYDAAKEDETELEPADHRFAMPVERRALVAKKLCPWPIWIQAIGRDLDSDEVFVQLRTTSRADWISLAVVAAREHVVELTRVGYPIDYASVPSVSRYLASSYALNERSVPPVDLAERSGMHRLADGSVGWLVGATWIGPNGTRVVPSPAIKASKLTRALFAQGTLDDWKLKFQEAMRQNSLARWLISASFASPLLSLGTDRTFVIHHWGESGRGKTALARFASSVWGHPINFTASFTGTAMSLTEQFRYLTDLHVTFNEIQAADYKNDLGPIVMRIVEETPRERVTPSGLLHKTGQHWRAIVRFTGEQSLLASKMHDLGGVTNRVIEFDAQVLERGFSRELHDWMESPDAAFGVAGPAFLRRIVGVANRDPVCFGTEARRFREAIETAIGNEDMRVEHLAAVAVAESLVLRFFLSVPADRARDRALKDAIDVARICGIHEARASYLAKARLAIREQAPAMRCLDFAAAQDRQRFHDRGIDGIEVILNPGRLSERYAGDAAWFFGGALRATLTRAGLTASRAIAELVAAGDLDCDRGCISTRRRVPDFGQRRVSVLRRLSPVTGEAGQDTDRDRPNSVESLDKVSMSRM